MPVAMEIGRLRLLPAGEADAAPLAALLAEPEVHSHLVGGAASGADVLGSLRAAGDRASSTTLWRIALPDADIRCAGFVSLAPPSRRSLALRAIGWRSLELLIALDPSHRRRGYATEALAAIADFAGADGVTFALVGSVAEGNVAAIRLMQRAGFHELGRTRDESSSVIVYEKAV